MIKPTKKKWLEIFPYGITLTTPNSRPILIFKDKTGREVLPVWMSQIDAGIAINDSQVHLPASSPHRLTQNILNKLSLKVEKCVFAEVVGHHQFVDLHFSGEIDLPVMRSRADEAMSFCLHARTRFWAPLELMRKAREAHAEMFVAEKNVQLMPQAGLGRPQYLN